MSKGLDVAMVCFTPVVFGTNEGMKAEYHMLLKNIADKPLTF